MKLLLPIIVLASTAAALPLPLATGNVADLSAAIGPLMERIMSPDTAATEPTIRDTEYLDIEYMDEPNSVAGPERRTSAGPERRTTSGPERRYLVLPELLAKKTSAAPERRSTVEPERRESIVNARETNWGKRSISNERDTASPDKRTTAAPEKMNTVGPELRNTATPERDLEDRGFIAPDTAEVE